MQEVRLNGGHKHGAEFRSNTYISSVQLKVYNSKVQELVVVVFGDS